MSVNCGQSTNFDRRISVARCSQ